MRKLWMAMSAALMLTSCSQEPEPIAGGQVHERADSMDVVEITFDFPNITQQAMTRGTLEAANMSDLWIFDFVGGSLVQTKHQQATDEGFGTVSVTADTGTHTFCFVASRGSDATVTDGEITWGKPSDTFWRSVTMAVTPKTGTAQSVELQRVATRLRISVADEVPTTLSKLVVNADTWYCGLDALTGEPTAANERTATINVPSSYAGTTGQLSASIFGICGGDYTTGVTVTALDGSNETIASVALADVPMQRNVTTQYSGPLFSRQQIFSLTAADSWGDDVVMTW